VKCRDTPLRKGEAKQNTATARCRKVKPVIASAEHGLVEQGKGDALCCEALALCCSTQQGKGKVMHRLGAAYPGQRATQQRQGAVTPRNGIAALGDTKQGLC
jgi:hypothetical protein